MLEWVEMFLRKNPSSLAECEYINDEAQIVEIMHELINAQKSLWVCRSLPSGNYKVKKARIINLS